MPYAQTVRRVVDLGFPQGPFSHDYERCYETWMRIEAPFVLYRSEIDVAAGIRFDQEAFRWIRDRTSGVIY